MANVYWYGGTGNWSDYTNHWSNNSGDNPTSNHGAVPGSDDNVIFDSLSNTTDYTVTIDATAYCANFTMGSPLSGKVTWAGTSELKIYGNINLSGGTTGITRTYTGQISCYTNIDVTSNGVELASNIYLGAYGSGNHTLSFLDNFSNPTKIINISGSSGNTMTVNTNNNAISFSQLKNNISSGGTYNLNFGTSTLTVKLQINMSGSGTKNIDADLATIIFDGTVNSYLIGAGSGTYGKVWNKVSGSAKSLEIDTSETITELKLDAGTITKFDNSTTTTIATFTALGTSGSHITISNTSGTTHATLTKSSAGVISGCDYIDIQEMTGSPALTWYIGPNSTDTGSTCTNIYLSNAPTFGFSSVMGIDVANISSINGIAIAGISKVDGI